MKYTIKNIKNRGLGFFVALISGASVYGQQDPVPTTNIPTGQVTTVPSAVAYPGLANFTAPANYNYIRTVVPDVPYQTMPAITSMVDRISTDYFDGLGRPLQSVLQKAHPNGNDIVQPHVYDAQGNEAYQYQPYAAPTSGISFLTNPGKLKVNVYDQLRGFYDHTANVYDEQPYSQSIFDNSPLNRIIKQVPPGYNWVQNGKGAITTYTTNNTLWQYQTELNSYGLAGGYPRWTIGVAPNAIPQYQGDYAAGQLTITTQIDEDGKITTVCKDKQDRVVIKFSPVTINTVGYYRPIDCAYTCYVYDEIGRLRCVMPPEAAKPTATTSNGLSVNWTLTSTAHCFTYFYDTRGRLVEKKMPDKDMEAYVYDRRDRLIMYQDGNLRNAVGYSDGLARWQFTYYDALDRTTMSTICTANEDRPTMTMYIYDNSTWGPSHWLYYFKDYTLMNTYPTSIGASTILNYNYYDDYSHSLFGFDGSQFPASNTYPADGTVVPSNLSFKTKGLLTGSSTLILNPDGSNGGYLSSTIFYDDNGRVIQTQSQNHKQGVEISSNLYYFQGMLYKNILRHQNLSAKVIPNATDGPITEFTIQNTFQLNLAVAGGNAKVWKHIQKINTGIDFQFGYYNYDHLGRVVTKQFPAGSELNEYSMRGFLNHIDFKDQTPNSAVGDIFEENLYYDNGFHNKLYNGNIAGITWSGSDHIKKSYGYSYDMLNRLTHAEFNQLAAPVPPATTGIWGKQTDLTASNITYDLNGNIQTMNQRVTATPGAAATQMDILDYHYTPGSNQLMNVHDNGTVDPTLPDFKDNANHNDITAVEYAYDHNGNITLDGNKNIQSITYNYLNKPVRIVVGATGSTTANTSGEINYTYDAIGSLLHKKIIDYNDPTHPEEWDYIGDFVYKNDLLQYILNEEGRARPVAAGLDGTPNNGNPNDHPTKFIYDYFAKDHLGNVRSTVTAEPLTYQLYARHEIATANIEQLIFDNIPSVRDAKPGSTDPDDQMAAGLDGGDPNTTIGTAVLLSTQPGDAYQISAQSFYESDYKQDRVLSGNDIVNSLMTTLTGGGTYAGVPLSELPQNVKTVSTLLSNPNLAGALQNMIDANNNINAPKAHLNYLWFNDKMQLDPKFSGSIQVQPNGTIGGTWNTLTAVSTVSGSTSTIIYPGGIGYLLIYIDNQSIGKKVWFDNVTILVN